jgi:hypothetical protein
MTRIVVNRAPVLTLWAAVVAEGSGMGAPENEKRGGAVTHRCPEAPSGLSRRDFV